MESVVVWLDLIVSKSFGVKWRCTDTERGGETVMSAAVRQSLTHCNWMGTERNQERLHLGESLAI